MKKLALITLLAVSVSCKTAGVQDAKHTAALTINAVEIALALADDTEEALRCSAPTAIVDHCISESLDVKLNGKFQLAFKEVSHARDLYVALPPCKVVAPATTCQTPTTSEIIQSTLRIADIVKAIIADFPQDAPATVNLKADPSVKAALSANGGQ